MRDIKQELLEEGSEFLNSEAKDHIDQSQVSLLYAQKQVMSDYLDILASRVELL